MIRVLVPTVAVFDPSLFTMATATSSVSSVLHHTPRSVSRASSYCGRSWRPSINRKIPLSSTQGSFLARVIPEGHPDLALMPPL